MEFICTKNEANSRVDKIIRRILKNAPLSFIYKMFRNKDIKVNKKRVDIDYILKENDVVDIYLKEELYERFKKDEITKQTVKFNLPIIYEDENLMIVNKPRGLLVHGDEKDKKNTLLNMFLSYMIQKKEYDPTDPKAFVPCLIHRLDRNTSGIIVLCKNYQTNLALNEVFKDHKKVIKTYLALVCGKVDKEGKIDKPLLKDSKTNTVKVSKDGKQAITLYKRKKCFTETSLVEVTLLTGRTHQIRVHFQSIGHPIIGDNKYGDFKMNKAFLDIYNFKDQFLHAYSLTFRDINGHLDYLNNKTFTCQLPEKEQKILNLMKGEL